MAQEADVEKGGGLEWSKDVVANNGGEDYGEDDEQVVDFFLDWMREKEELLLHGGQRKKEAGNGLNYSTTLF